MRFEKIPSAQQMGFFALLLGKLNPKEDGYEKRGEKSGALGTGRSKATGDPLRPYGKQKTELNSKFQFVEQITNNDVGAINGRPYE